MVNAFYQTSEAMHEFIAKVERRTLLKSSFHRISYHINIPNWHWWAHAICDCFFFLFVRQHLKHIRIKIRPKKWCTLRFDCTEHTHTIRLKNFFFSMSSDELNTKLKGTLLHRLIHDAYSYKAIFPLVFVQKKKKKLKANSHSKWLSLLLIMVYAFFLLTNRMIRFFFRTW